MDIKKMKKKKTLEIAACLYVTILIPLVICFSFVVWISVWAKM